MSFRYNVIPIELAVKSLSYICNASEELQAFLRLERHLCQNTELSVVFYVR